MSQILRFAKEKTLLFQDSPDLHHPATASNLLSLLLAPIKTYPSVLQLLSLDGYEDLLRVQPFSTRRSIAHAVVHSVLRNDTVISTPEQVDEVFGLCHVLISDQKDAGVGMPSYPARREKSAEDMAEEQGWIARMVHLFRSDSIDTQLAVRPHCSFSHPLIIMADDEGELASAKRAHSFLCRRSKDTLHFTASYYLHHRISAADQLSKRIHPRCWEQA